MSMTIAAGSAAGAGAANARTAAAWPAAVERLKGPATPIRGLPCGAPLLLAILVNEIRRSREAEHSARIERARRVGFDNGLRNGHDFGHSIREAVITGRDGQVLRASDILIEFGPDPARPRHDVRRARRIDPLETLYRRGTIDGRSLDAAEALRDQLQQSECIVGAGGQSEIHVPAHQRAGASFHQVEQRTLARKALAAVSERCRPVVVFVCLGGTLDHFAQFARRRRAAVVEELSFGLLQLADHYFQLSRGTIRDESNHYDRVGT